MAEQPDQPSQSDNGIDYKAKYEELFAACGKANGEKKALLAQIAKNIGALLKVVCEPDPPGCSGPIPNDKLADLLLRVQQENASKKQKLEVIDSEINQLMQKICEPDPPGCAITHYKQ